MTRLTVYIGCLCLVFMALFSPSTLASGDAILVRAFINADAPYPQSHASTIVETTDGRLVAAWFGGLHEKHPEVAIYVAHHDGDAWQPAVAVADGRQADGSQLPTWNPVLFQPVGGPLHLFYKVGPNPQEWWGVLKTSDDGGETWSEPRRLPDGLLGPIKNKPVISGMGAWIAPSSTEGPEGWRLRFERSEDQGATWTAGPTIDPGPGIDAIQPSILFHADGRLQAVARTRQGALAASWSSDRGKTWSPMAAIELPNPNAGTDAVTLADGRQLLVYNHAAHNPSTPGKGPRYPLSIALSEDGIRWRRVLDIEEAALREGYAYPAVIQGGDGRVHITYTVAREKIRHVVVDPARLEP